ncbi:MULTISPECIES: hypothetical protein [unclassified Rhodococcus (in: high G+C Gram-positive bacteria)]|uniref:hypothetical protein n=1 Tax=unclassified Rhodococcus (in: high G+C Gram-positive bacteria) TaxID=192944 RepID=UPI0015953975|nr:MULTISPECIES: hypothetical protein [unclassified Rhodococcus (in: high G+C Gram-positive bacteria)]
MSIQRSTYAEQHVVTQGVLWTFAPELQRTNSVVPGSSHTLDLETLDHAGRPRKGLT